MSVYVRMRERKKEKERWSCPLSIQETLNSEPKPHNSFSHLVRLSVSYMFTPTHTHSHPPTHPLDPSR